MIWKPIEKARRDGTRMLMSDFGVRDNVFIGRFEQHSSIFNSKVRDVVIDDSNTIRQKGLNIYPTHFMELPHTKNPEDITKEINNE